MSVFRSAPRAPRRTLAVPAPGRDDWADTPLGPQEEWPSALLTAAELCLRSPFPGLVAWGPENVMIYNEGLAPIIGAKHPSAQGMPYRDVFPEIWDSTMAPLLAQLVDEGVSSYLQDRRVLFEREGRLEEMFFTFSWSPVPDHGGGHGGALHMVQETTRAVRSVRRQQMLRDVVLRAVEGSRPDRTVEAALKALEDHRADVPRAAVWLTAADGESLLPVELPGGPDSWVSPDQGLLRRVAKGVGGLLVDAPEGVAPVGEDPAMPARSMLLLPLRAAEESLGVLAVLLHPLLPLDEDYRATLDLLADHLASVVDRARTVARARATSLALQRSLLPQLPAAAPGLEVASRYLPGSVDTEVGGDWFDVIDLGASRVALVLGDVMGRGLRAAAVMGQVRAATHGYAQLDLEPAEVLTELDRLVEGIGAHRDIPEIVTCVYGVYDGITGTFSYASAGHPPPLLLPPDGPAEVMTVPVGGPLGLGSSTFGQRTVTLDEGTLVALYSDGLVERRGEDLVASIHAAAARLVPGTRSAEDAATALLDGVTPPDDDTAVLVVRTRRPEVLEVVERDLPEDPSAPRLARTLATEALGRWGADETTLDSAVLILSELVTNAVKHGNPPVGLRLLRHGSTLVLEVSDSDRRRPRRRAADADEESGRGIEIVMALATRSGVRPTAAGKATWAELPLP